MIGRVNCGGGGNYVGYILVVFPSGSVCTCTKGTKVLTAKYTLGGCAFEIPELGTWTVSCTDGTHTSTKSVTISTEGQYESVVLTYTSYLYRNGVINTSIGGGIVSKTFAASITFKNENNKLYFYAHYASGSYAAAGWMGTNSTVDLTLISTVSITVDSATKSFNGWDFVISYANTGGKATIYNNAAVKRRETGTITSKTVITLDVSSLTGSYYIGIMGSGGGGTNPNNATIYVSEWSMT